MTTQFRVGDRISFGRGAGEQTTGEVIRVNAKRLKIRTTEARGRHAAGTIWNVGPGICRLVTAAPRPPKRPDAEILSEIRGLYGNLSPENLSGDGELPAWVVARRGNTYRRRLRECFEEIGREVTEAEFFTAPRGDTSRPPARETAPAGAPDPVQERIASLLARF